MVDKYYIMIPSYKVPGTWEKMKKPFTSKKSAERFANKYYQVYMIILEAY